jgi:hypothetical protein
MRNKEKVHEWIDRFNHNNLTEEELALFTEMVKRDPRLREEVLLDREINSFLAETDFLELRKKICKVCAERPGGKNSNSRIILMAASFLVLFSVGWILQIIMHRGSEQPGIKREGLQTTSEHTVPLVREKRDDIRGSSVLVKKEEQSPIRSDSLPEIHDLLACYQPDKMLENLIGTTNRTTGFRLLKPEQSSVYLTGGVILFSWVTDTSEETSVIVQNNRGITRYESESNSKQSVGLNASFFGNGLFYFKIMRKDEIVCFGKFIIRDKE